MATIFDFLDTFTLFCGDDVCTGDVKAATSPAEMTTASATKTAEENNNDELLVESVVDPMDETNYIISHLSRPMGILFEENYEQKYGGAFVTEINEGCSAAANGSICRGDQLIAIGDKRVSGLDFDDVIKLIHDSSETEIKLTLFRGPADCLYGPNGASIEWLNEFVAERGEEAALVEDSESEVMPGSSSGDIIAVASSQELGSNDGVFDMDVVGADPPSGLVRPYEGEEAEASQEKQEIDVVADGTKSNPDIEAHVEKFAEATEVENKEVGACEEVESEVVDAESLDGAVNRASKEWLDNYLQNPAGHVATDGVEITPMKADKTITDLDARVEKAVRAKDAALKAVDDKENTNNAKGILKTPRYSGKKEEKVTQQSPVDVMELDDDESAASSVWSESDNYIGKVLIDEEHQEDVPMKQVGSSLAAMGAASTLATSMMLS